MAKKAKPRGGGGAWAIAVIVVVMVAGGIWIATQHPWRGTGRTAAPVPNLKGQALQMSRSGGEFSTIEQIEAQSPKAGTVVKVQAQLQGFQLAGEAYQITLASPVHPGATMNAQMPPGSAAGNLDDGALYDELRQDFALRFGAPTAAVQHPQQPTTVVVTGVIAGGPAGPVLRPLLDLHVQ